MMIGSLFTLFVVPSIYMLVARTRTAAASTEALEAEIGEASSPFGRFEVEQPVGG